MTPTIFKGDEMSGNYSLELIDGEVKKVYYQSPIEKCSFCNKKLDRRRVNMEHFDGSCVKQNNDVKLNKVVKIF